MRKTAKTLFAPVAAAILGVAIQGATAPNASAEVTLDSIKAAGKDQRSASPTKHPTGT